MQNRSGNIRRNKLTRRCHDRREDEERRKLPEEKLIRKILVTGDRDWTDIKRVVEELKNYRSGTILIHGACQGADNTCAAVAEALGFEVRAYPADWKNHGRAAGPIRNQFMIDAEHKLEEPIDLCLAFHNSIESSRGTADMLKRVNKSNIESRLITSHPILP